MRKLHSGMGRGMGGLIWLRWAVGATICTGFAQAAGLNDTGITDCSNDTVVVSTGVEADTGSHPRQDCRYGRDPAAAAGMPKTGAGGKGFDFTKIANNGTELPESAVLGTGATDWACTRDNITGRIWEIKTTSGLRSASHRYTWFLTSPVNGIVGLESGGVCANNPRCDTEKFVADVNSVGLCGDSAWRMPTLKELESIVDFGRAPSIDPMYFPNTPGSFTWTGQRSPEGGAFTVVFADGRTTLLNFGEIYFVRLVRSGP